jgi:hypothetical protein
MGDRFTVIMLGVATIVPSPFATAQPQQTFSQPASQTASASAWLSVPKGKTTVIGGEIHSVDPVRDAFKLSVFGGKPMRILFDARTQMYRDGKRVSLNDLRANEHASVETVLDGTNIFALSIHMLSQSPEGQCQGQVMNYNPGSGNLTVSATLSREPITLAVPAGTSIVREGQSGFSSGGSGASDLVKGALVSVNFRSGSEGRAIASHIAILAIPGSAFVFSGNISVLDMHSGSLVIVDPSDNKTYQVFFDPARFSAENLREGEHVRVTAEFDGNRYMASAISGS